jgi:hypothetical protein
LLLKAYIGNISSAMRDLQFKLILGFQVISIVLVFGLVFLICEKVKDALGDKEIFILENGDTDG